jgi:hypothetical protein
MYSQVKLSFGWIAAIATKVGATAETTLASDSLYS